MSWTYRKLSATLDLVKAKSGKEKPKAKLIPEKRATPKPVKHKTMVPVPAAWER
jgi:hypothetical protein